MFGMLGVLHVEDVRCLGCGMFGIWDGGDMVCWVVRCW